MFRMWSQVSFLGNTFDYDHIETSSHAHQIKFHAKSGCIKTWLEQRMNSVYLTSHSIKLINSKVVYAKFAIQNLKEVEAWGKEMWTSLNI